MEGGLEPEGSEGAQLSPFHSCWVYRRLAVCIWGEDVLVAP